MDTIKRAKLILCRLPDNVVGFVEFKIEQQTLRGVEFNASCSYMQQTDAVVMVSDDRPAIYRHHGPHTELYVLGRRLTSDHVTLAGSPHLWDLIKAAVLDYNQRYSQNTLTEDDVIWKIPVI
jgi:hypothetical protein